MPSPFHFFAASWRRRTCVALILTTILVSKSRPASMSRKVCVGRAKQKFARVRTPPVRIDRPAERQVVAWDVVDDRLALGLDELDAAELGRIEAPPRDLEELLWGHARTIEHMFDSRQAAARRS